jgi:2'-5' RNA ligase
MMARNRAARPEARPLRLFAAVDIPDRVRDAVVEAIQPWREGFPEGRWVRSENWHVTLKFLGRTWPRLVGWVHDMCRESAAGIRPFRLGLDGLGVFPGPTAARVLWVGLEDEEGGLTALARAVEHRLSNEFPREKRPFSAHLTVARFNPPASIKGHAEDLAAAEVGAKPFRVGHLTLYRSHLSPRGARYEALERFPLLG